MTLRPSSIALLSAFAAVGCAPIDVTARAGYARMEVAGDLALTAGNQAPIEQGVESAFGLGQAQGSPFFSARAEAGGPTVSASVLWLRESGAGQLASAFGGLSANTNVTSNLDLALSRVGFGYGFDLGPVELTPGVLFDVFALDFTAREATLGGREEIDEIVFVPLPFVRAAADVGPLSAAAEVGYLDVSGFGDTDGRFFDVEASLEWRLLPHGHVFASYRLLGIDGSGDTGDDSFAADLVIRGWMLGGGVRF